MARSYRPEFARSIARLNYLFQVIRFASHKVPASAMLSQHQNRAELQMADATHPARNLRVITARSLDALDIHMEAWDRLAWESSQAAPTLLPDWVKAFLQHRIKPLESWSCSFAYDGATLVGVLMVVAAPHPLLGRRRPVLRTAFDQTTTTSDILLAPAAARPVLSLLLETVADEYPNHIGLDLRAVRSSSPSLQALSVAKSGYFVFAGKCHRYSQIDTRGVAAEYFSKLGGLKRNLNRYRKRLDAKGPVSVEFRSGPAAKEDFLDEFLTLEASGWKGRNGTAIRNSAQEVDFYAALVRDFAAKHRLEWHIIRLRSQVVAAELAVRCGTALALLKIAFAEDFADCMPGNLLTGEVIRRSFSQPETSELNHLSDMEWHQAWRMDKNAYQNVHLVRRGLFCSAVHLAYIKSYIFLQVHVKPRLSSGIWTSHRKLRWRRSL